MTGQESPCGSPALSVFLELLRGCDSTDSAEQEHKAALFPSLEVEGDALEGGRQWWMGDEWCC